MLTTPYKHYINDPKHIKNPNLFVTNSILLISE